MLTLADQFKRLWLKPGVKHGMISSGRFAHTSAAAYLAGHAIPYPMTLINMMQAGLLRVAADILQMISVMI